MKLGLEAGKDTLDLALAHGVQGVPVSAGDLVNKGVDATLSPLREQGLAVCQIGAFGFNALRVDPEQRRILEAVIPLAAQTGCPYIVIGPGNYHPSAFGAVDKRNFTGEALDEMATVLEPLVALAEEHGAKLSIEAYLKGAVNGAERFLDLWGRLQSPAICVNIDPTSLYDFGDMVDPTPFIEGLCPKLAGHYGLIHVKEVGLAEGFHLHAGLVPLGDGPTDWAHFLRLSLPHLPADSWLILEHVQSAAEAERSLSLLRRALTKGAD